MLTRRRTGTHRALGIMPSSAALCAVTLGALLGAPQAVAVESVYCVSCVNPEQTYACSVTSKGPLPGDAVQIYCVMRTAKEGGHASCSARRSNAKSACPGQVLHFDYDGPLPEDLLRDAAANPRVQRFLNRIEQENAKFAEPQTQTETKSGPPKTVVEVIGNSRERLRRWRGQTSPQAPESIELQTAAPQAPAQTQTTAPASDAQPAVQPPQQAAQSSGFARNAWRCVRSLFRDCRGETASAPVLQE